MGNIQSRDARQHHRSASEINLGLSSVHHLIGKEYNFQNLVLEGNGPKSLAYIGALKALERVGILDNLKRFTGVGTSGVIAALLAADFNCDAIQALLNQHIDNIIADNSSNVVAKDLVEKLGCSTGKRFLDWFGNILKTRFGNPDITFKQLFEKTGKEVCIVATNLNRNREEYFHVTITPDVEIRRAVHMTISFPGLSQPVKYCLDGQESYYLDGGIICNYPINCFDGWWLSTRPEKIMIRYSSEIDVTTLYEDRLAGRNLNTLGIILFDYDHFGSEYDAFRLQLGVAQMNPGIPNTKLGREFEDYCEERLLQLEVYSRFSDCCARFCELLCDLKDCDDLVDVKPLARALSGDMWLSIAEKGILFGTTLITEEDCIEFLHKISKGKEKVIASDILALLETKSWVLYSQCLCCERIEITDLRSYWRALTNTIHRNTKNVLARNMDRTIAIYTGYIGNNVLQLEEDDERYLYQQGWNCAASCLRLLTQ
ncbi:uncharacterized protein LOC115232612 [Argonauta hians]